MPSEFKISRLRYNYLGSWAQDTFYNRDAIITYQGKVYVCKEPHTSGNTITAFYDALYNEIVPGAPLPYWEIVVSGRSWVGEWESATFYSLDNIVRYGGALYICNEQHTSGAVIDLTKFELFTVSSAWNPLWETNHAYGKGDVVKYGGIIYSCNTNHVSAASTSLGLEEDQSKWTILLESIEYKGAWNSGNYRYKKNDIVKNGPDLWISESGHTSSTVFDQTKWNLWIPGQRYIDGWLSSSIYQIGDVTLYGGYSYVSIVANNEDNVPSTTSVAWELLTKGYDLQGTWNSSANYKVGDVVRIGGMLYTATQDNVNENPTVFVISKSYTTPVNIYTGFLPATGNTIDYVAGPYGSVTFASPTTPLLADLVALAPGSEITLNGTITRTIVTPFINSGGNWTASTLETGAVGSIDITSANIPINVDSHILWVNNTTSLVPGLILTGPGFSLGQTIVSIIDGNKIRLSEGPDATLENNQTIILTGINYSYWNLLVPGSNWTGFWEAGVTYSIGDIALLQNKTYKCIQSHSSSIISGDKPDTDNDNMYWIPFTLHARNNALTNQGDLLSRYAGTTQPVAIGETDQVLQATEVDGEIIPQWKKILVSPKLFYVSESGVDSADYGTTWDRPWRTIKYAAEQVIAGTENFEIKQCLEANKKFLTTEMYQWMLYQKQYSVAPFTPSSTFDPDKTVRDASYIIDGIVYDLTRVGNAQTVINARAFFNSEGTGSYINDTVAAQMPYFIAGLERLKTLMLEYVLLGIDPPILYQEKNGVNPGDIITLQTGFDVGFITDVEDLFDIVLNALQDATPDNIPAPNTGLTVTIMVKTGTYEEELPIVVPEYCAIVGDELRGVTVQPKLVINTFTTRSTASSTIAATTTMTGSVGHSEWTFTTTGRVNLKATTLPYHSYGNNADPNTPEDQAVEKTWPWRGGTNIPATTKVGTGDGIIGYWLNGVHMFSPESASTPQGFIAISGFNYNASAYSAYSLNYSFGDDEAGGHTTTAGEYAYTDFSFDVSWTTGDGFISGPHNTGTPDADAIPYLSGSLIHPDGHSKILGITLDGYPVYGPFGYNSPLNPASGVKIVETGYTLKNSSYRAGTAASDLEEYPMGIFIQDYEFTDAGDLDESNGRYCVTPDYPNGTYAYFITVDSVELTPVYPYVVGNTFYGVPADKSPTVSVDETGGGIAPLGVAQIKTGGYFTCYSTQDMEADMPIQFVASSNFITNLDRFEDAAIIPGNTYYVKGDTLTSTTFQVSEVVGGNPVGLAGSNTGFMQVIGGDATKDMFLLRNATGLRNLTLKGLLGTLTQANEYLTQRPTGGSYCAFDPGTGPDDTTTWIKNRSPYCQNVTLFGAGCTAMKVDGSLHNGGNRSMTANDFTCIISDGVGAWVTGTESKAELISVFTYYNYTGYFAEDGGRIRAANGNCSYGTFGAIAEGYDTVEDPITATVDNQTTEASASVQQAFGDYASLLKLQYNNAGVEYIQTVTNLLNYSNDFLGTGWTTDGNINIAKNLISPSGLNDGWTLTGTTSNTDSSYIYKNITIPPQGAVFTGLSGSNISGSGSAATFDVTVSATSYSVVVSTTGTGGSGYVLGNQITIYGSQVGGQDGVNDITLTVASLVGSTIITVTAVGTVPAGAALRYTFSVHAKRATSNSFDLYAIFSGSSTRTSHVSFNFLTETLTAGNGGDGGLTPSTSYRGIEYLNDDWYRIWFSVYDPQALNNTVQLRIYPRTQLGTSGATSFYGAQVEIGSSPKFYLSTTTGLYDAYADYIISGAGVDAKLVADETRSNSVYQSRITDPGSGAGGAGYLTASNNAQGGNESYVVLAQSDINSAANYNGMRIFINSGTGAGQYGFISDYDATTKIAYVLKESVTPITISAAATVDDTFTLLGTGEDVYSLYENQPVQFVPTYYSTTVTNTSQESFSIISIIGGTTNTMATTDTSILYYNMQITFSGNIPETAGVIANYTYFVSEIIDEFYFKISSSSFGPVLALTSVTPSGMFVDIPSNTSFLKVLSTSGMDPNMPIQFTGSALGGITLGDIYYINDVIDGTRLSISSALLTPTITATDQSTNRLTVSSTNNLNPLSPIVFSEPAIGGVPANTKFYISKISNATEFKIADSILTVLVTDTAFGTNLITCASTAGFVTNNPIRFTGNSFGGLQAEQVYYILAINDSFTFTVSNTPGGSSQNLTTAVGYMTARTCPADYELITDAGSMPAKTTIAKTTLTRASGSIMNAIFSTPVFGGVEQGVTYYIKTITAGPPDKIQISETPGGAAFNVTTGIGTMRLGQVGWDHVNLGTPAEVALDTTSLYYIEPRLTYAAPTFTQEASTLPTAGAGATYVAIAYGDNYWIAVPDSYTTISVSPNGSSWDTITLPTTTTPWTDIAYGNTAWVLISSTQKVMYSFSKGQSWKASTMPAGATQSWSYIAYGNGSFVALCPDGTAAESTNFGATWNSVTAPFNTMSNVTGLTYGAGKFVAVTSGGLISWYTNSSSNSVTAFAPPGSARVFTSVAYGNGRFVAVAGGIGNDDKPVYSFDGETWYESVYTINATKVSYGNGIFLAVAAGSTIAYTSEDGLVWKRRNITITAITDLAFGFSATHPGRFVTVGAASTGSVILGGAVTKGRPIVETGVITSVTEFETGGGYITPPTITLFDPNVTTVAVLEARVGNGVLSAPTFIDPGQGYNTSSTAISINGSGYADAYQTGLAIRVSNLTQLPRPGDDLVVDNDDTIYKVTSAVVLNGTSAPNLTAEIELSPPMSVALSPDHDTPLVIRERYSQVRLTNHDFLNIGFGDERLSGYPNPVPAETTLQPQNQTIENNYGRVFYTSTDQDGNFKVGNLFGVEQATGIVTLSASQFGLSGLETLSLGGIAVGGSSVVITQFSTDATFVANSDQILPTQKAVKSYLTARLSQGGSNTFTGNTTAGSVTIGGPNVIGSTIPKGTEGHGVNMLNKVLFDKGGDYGMIDGDMMAFDMFMRGKGTERIDDPRRISR